jgi:hypothetical protein
MTTIMNNADTSRSKAADKGVLCPKCEHLNPPGTKVCNNCGCHLFVTCQSCGARNQRALSRCSSCGHQLHRSPLKRALKKLHLDKVKFAPAQALAIIIVVIVSYLLITKISSKL